jgi:hypothetical protein
VQGAHQGPSTAAHERSHAHSPPNTKIHSLLQKFCFAYGKNTRAEYGKNTRTPEHTALTSWLSTTTAQEMCVAVPLEATSGGVQSQHPAQHVRRPQVLDPDPATHATVPTRTPPCIRGQIISIDQHDHLLLKSLLPMSTHGLDISGISDQLLAEYLCQTRSVFPFQQSEHVVTQVECLLPL